MDENGFIVDGNNEKNYMNVVVYIRKKTAESEVKAYYIHTVTVRKTESR